MQTANIMLALAGNMGHTIQKWGVTPAEIAVLREIHGESSVFDIEPVEDVQRNGREERARLLEIYGKPAGSREVSAVEVLFPGVAARLFETLDELELDPSFYKATSRAMPKKAKEPEPDEVDEQESETTDEPEPAPKPKKAPAAKVTKAAPAKTSSTKRTGPLFK
jgi:hypothetical protein